MDWVAFFTAALALATVILAIVTYKLELAWKETSAKQIDAWEKNSTNQIRSWQANSADQIGVQTWLHFKSIFDSSEMKRCRKKLAEQLPYERSKHDEIAEDLLDLFEDIGTVYHLGLLNKKLAESTFSYYANHWWRAAKPYVDQERMVHGDDDSLFKEFENLAKLWRIHDPEISDDDLKEFLEEERGLRVAD